MKTSEKLTALREQMRAHGVDGWLAASADPHLSEYLPLHWQVRAWLSGFTGSAGTLVLTQNEAAVWTDSRYWEQAARQLEGSGIALGKLGEAGTAAEWLLDKLPENGVLGMAADMLSVAEHGRLQQTLAAKNIRLRTDLDLPAQVWHDRPALPEAAVYLHPAEFVSETAAEKLARVRQAMRERGADYHLVSSLDDIAWMCNLRGSDVAFNPVFLAHLLLDGQHATLFIDEGKIDAAVQAALDAAGIETAPYDAAADALAALSGSLLFSPEHTAVGILSALPESVRRIEAANPSSAFKAIKSPDEIAHLRQAMRQDGAALCGFFAELERKLADGATVTECDVDTLLLAHRRLQPHFVSHSFDTIAGFNGNGAMPHYRAEAETCSTITGSGLLLIDSGGQYFNGTTDITRVIAIGEPTPLQKRDYTLVLKAHIALAETVFPEHFLSTLLDAICRKPLWQAQRDYGHGTGHGVGYFLNVHEGPQRIAYQVPAKPDHAMKAGMITSNEPGLYRPNQWGIRIENLVANQKIESPEETAFGSYLYFETLTLCPIDTRPIDAALLTAEETAWLDAYHTRVRQELLPLVDGAARDWLLANTEPLAATAAG